MSSYGLSIDSGYYFGDGYNSSGYSGYSSGSATYGNKVASSTTQNRISRDLAQGYSRNIGIINKYLEQGDIDQALESYNELLEKVKGTAYSYGYELTDEQIASQLDSAYQRATGLSFADAIDEETHSPFVTGLLEGLPVIGWFTNGNSNAEALAKLDGREVKAGKHAGEAVGAGLATGALGLGAVCLIGGPVGWIVAGGLALNTLITYGCKNK